MLFLKDIKSHQATIHIQSSERAVEVAQGALLPSRDSSPVSVVVLAAIDTRIAVVEGTGITWWGFPCILTSALNCCMNV